MIAQSQSVRSVRLTSPEIVTVWTGPRGSKVSWVGELFRTDVMINMMTAKLHGIELKGSGWKANHPLVYLVGP